MVIIIDNYDSFTFNLYQLVAALAGSGTSVEVVRNDALPPHQLVRRAPTHVILSPGPGHPRDAGLSRGASDLLPTTPLLGVCLGHQALALAHGATVARSPRPIHGRTVAVSHDGVGIFAGIPSPFSAALYHSLRVEAEALPDALVPCARNDAGDIMALRHRDRPHWGVQFHPESFMTAPGRRLLANFLQPPGASGHLRGTPSAP